MIGVSAWGAYLPRLRLDRKAAAHAMQWLVPGLAKARGTRAMCNWDEDVITMAVEAARDALGAADDRTHIDAIMLATTTAPFADRLNAGIVASALTLDERLRASDCTGTQRAGLSAMLQAAALVTAETANNALVVAADQRRARAGAPQQLDWGDGSAAIVLSGANVAAELIGSATITEDFVDHFRGAGDRFDYGWEERWVRDEGVTRLLPRAIAAALSSATVRGEDVTHFCLPSPYAGMSAKIARQAGIGEATVRDNLSLSIGETGTAHALLMLADALDVAAPGDVILVAQFGQGAEALVLRCTDLIAQARPARGVGGSLRLGVIEPNYMKYLVFNDLLEWERGPRGERDNRTALSTLHRNAAAIMGFVGGRCTKTGVVQFPASRISVAPNATAIDTQEPYKLAERTAHVVAWTADALAYSVSPPQFYGPVDFEGGGRVTMDFTDVDPGQIDTGSAMRMAFRIKDFDERRGFRRYVWKAIPAAAREEEES